MTVPAAIGTLGPHADAVTALVERARQDIPFYAHHLRDSAGRPLFELPTCTKADLAGWGPFPLHAGDVRAAARISATSGTTGPRLFIGYSAADWARIGTQLAHRAAAVGLGPGDLLCNTHGYGLWIGGPALDLMAAVSGAALLPLGPGNTEQLLASLSEMPITAMSATPSFLRFLADRIEHDGLDTSCWSLRLGLIGGEGASVRLRRRVIDALGDGFAWQELYGSTEVGGPVLGWAPPDDLLSGALLLDTAEFVVELLHPDRDEPVAPGEIGELTITTPWRQLSPLVRYRTRDLTASVEIGHPSGFPAVRSIVGRVDDALKVRGALVYPGAIEHVVVGHCAPGSEWRIVVERDGGALDVLTVVVEHDSPDADGLADALADALGVRCAVTSVASGSLERFEGKARRVLDHRPD